MEENIELKKQLIQNPNQNMDVSLIVKETIKNIKIGNNGNKKKALLMRIQELAGQRKLSLSELKEVVVDNEALCSRATFYRYVDKLKKKGIIDFVKIDDFEIIVKI